ncbi:MAG: metal ABC transporter substrate-binding protein [Candidatus Woesebacteria bacterium]
MKQKMVVVLGILVGAVGFFLFAQNQPKTEQSQEISVVVSFYPLAEFSKEIGGNLISVTTLTPPGSEPHDFEPNAKDLIALQKAKLFVYNGAGLEIWLDKIGADVKAHTSLINSSQGISLHTGNTEGQEMTDPHIWMDPVLASTQVENIKNGLIQVDPTHTTVYETNAKAYQQELMTLDHEFFTGLSNCARHEIVTSHNAFGYLAQRYGLTVQSVSGLSPDEEPSPKKLAEVVQFIRKQNVKYIFFETLLSPKLAQTLASETGTKTIVFNPLEGLTTDEIAQGKTYLSVQRENLAALKTALGCQ